MNSALKISPVAHSSFVVERSFNHPPERLFRALSEAPLRRLWFAEGDMHDVEVFDSAFEVGGREHLRYRFGDASPFPGKHISDETRFLDIVEDKRIVTASTMSFEEQRISSSLVTLEITKAADGQSSHLRCTFQGAFYDGADGAEIREQGWQYQMQKLAQVLDGEPA